MTRLQDYFSITLGQGIMNESISSDSPSGISRRPFVSWSCLERKNFLASLHVDHSFMGKEENIQFVVLIGVVAAGKWFRSMSRN